MAPAMSSSSLAAVTLKLVKNTDCEQRVRETPRPPARAVLLAAGEPPALKAAEAVIARVLAELKMEYGTKETSLSVRLEFDGESAGSRFGDDDARRLLSLLSLLPHGVLKMSHDLEGLVSERRFCFRA